MLPRTGLGKPISLLGNRYLPDINIRWMASARHAEIADDQWPIGKGYVKFTTEYSQRKRWRMEPRSSVFAVLLWLAVSLSTLPHTLSTVKSARGFCRSRLSNSWVWKTYSADGYVTRRGPAR